MSFEVIFKGKHITYSSILYCKNDFGARPSSEIDLSLQDVASKIQKSSTFKLELVTKSYIVLQRGETTISVMKNGEMLLQNVPRGDPKEAERVVSELFGLL